MIIKSRIKKSICIIISLVLFSVVFWFVLPDPLFEDPTSTVLYDCRGNLLGAKIADDGQWRFPSSEAVPGKFAAAILTFEDQDFLYHPGVNPLSMIRALHQNILSGKIVSGGSTLTMQVIRMAGKGRPRTLAAKITEMVLSLRLELSLTKREILAMYCSNAPFGGNVVGLDAAAWRYFGRNPDELSWAESAMLAVLPNAPSLIHPGKNRELLLEKRNGLLDKLYTEGKIDSVGWRLSKLEPLPQKPHPLPDYAPHLLLRVFKEKKGSCFHSTLNRELQIRMLEIIERHHKVLQNNQIHNAALLVAEVNTGNVIAYVGNTNGKDHGNRVDICLAPRSTGSILKPFLYAAMLDEGMILENTLIPDIPTYISGFTPKNFDLGYSGAVPAQKALSRSLNIPAVRMLREYGVDRFHFILKKLGLSYLTKHPGHYGLSLILGGAEASLWQLAGVFSSMTRTLNHFSTYSGKYDPGDFRPLNYNLSVEHPIHQDIHELTNKGIFSAGAIFITYKALQEVNRPTQEAGWEFFASSQPIAWKTGTSFGFRDAWAIGTSGNYVVAVWAGNADGEGRPGLTGISAAAPIMFDVFDCLPDSPGFTPPYDELVQVPVCHQSGHRISRSCDEADTVWITTNGLRSPPCPYHQIIHLDSSRQYRVTSLCESTHHMVHQSWFVLPPVQEWYYKSGHPEYKPLPPYRIDCIEYETTKGLAFIYPQPHARMYIPVQLDGTPSQVIFEIATRDPALKVYWHLDDLYLGKTQYNHQMHARPSKGIHIMTAVSETGEEAIIKFEILNP